MSTARVQSPEPDSAYSRLLQCTVRGCEVAKESAAVVTAILASGSHERYRDVRTFEEELDSIDREINEGVTSTITRVSATEARELLACLKFIIELERIGDLLLNVANRIIAVHARLEPQDSVDMARMASILAAMLGDVQQAFTERDLKRAIRVLQADAELDRLRNLVLVRHIENPEHEPVRESFHLVFMCQTLERAGDHVKNLAEEICHLVSGKSIRHVLRGYDRSSEQMFVERLRRQVNEQS